MDALGLEVDHSVTMAPEMGDRIATVASARTQFQISTAAMIWARFTCEEQTRHFDYIFAPRCLTFDCDFGITDAEISYILVKCGIHLRQLRLQSAMFGLSEISPNVTLSPRVTYEKEKLAAHAVKH